MTAVYYMTRLAIVNGPDRLSELQTQAIPNRTEQAASRGFWEI